MSRLRAWEFEDALGRALGVDGGGALSALTPREGTALLRLEHDFLRWGAGLVREAAQLTLDITNATVLEKMAKMGVEAVALDSIVKRNETAAVIDAKVMESESETVKSETPPLRWAKLPLQRSKTTPPPTSRSASENPFQRSFLLSRHSV